MTRKNPSDLERELPVLQDYQRLVGMVGAVIPGERPDFVVATSTRKLGVEVTQYHVPKQAGERFTLKQFEMSLYALLAREHETRDSYSGLDGKQVRLNLIRRMVPPPHEQNKFISEIRKIAAEVETSDLPEEALPKKINLSDVYPIELSSYLTSIEVRPSKASITWATNFDVAWVGTSEEELLKLLGNKLSSTFDTDLDELHLLIAGDGVLASENIGMLGLKNLNDFTSLNTTIQQSQFDVVAMLDYTGVWVWRQDMGWIEHPKDNQT